MRYSPFMIGFETPQTYFILVAVARRPLNAYSICKQIEEDSGGVIIMHSSSLHHALKRLLHRRLIEKLEDPNRRPRYALKPAGRRVLESEINHHQRAMKSGQLALLRFECQP